MKKKVNRYLHQLKTKLEDYQDRVEILSRKKKRSENLKFLFDADNYQFDIDICKEKISKIKERIRRIESNLQS